MSFSLWPSSSDAENAISSVAGKEKQLSTPALDFIQILHSASLEVSSYRDLVKDEYSDTSATVGYGGQAVVELSRRPGVVIKRMRRFRYGDSKHASRADENLARVTLELRILTSASLLGRGAFVKVVGVCFEESIASLDPSGAGQFHLLLEHSELGDMASFLGQNGQQLDTKIKIDLASQVSFGLVSLHHDFICHGDLKVQNVLVFNGDNGRYRAKLADFGLSVHLFNDGEVVAFPKRDVYYPLGTPLLNAPEVRNRYLSTRSIDIAAAIRADVFSFGLLLWEILKDGQSYFNMAWSDTARASKLGFGTEEQMAFLSTLPRNGLLMRGEEFLVAQDLDEQLHEQILRLFHASLQDDPLQRQPMLRIAEIFLPPTKKNRIEFDKLEVSLKMASLSYQGFQTWSTSFPIAEFLDYTCLNLPDSLQRRAFDELKLCATSPPPFDDFDKLRERAALNLAECHLISFGTGYDSAEALRWLKVAKSYGLGSPLCLRRISEALMSLPPEVFERPENQLEAAREGTEIESCATSELYLMRKLQSRIASAVTLIRALSPEGQSWLHAPYLEMQATEFLATKSRFDVFKRKMTTLDIAALLGEDEIMARLLPAAEAFKGDDDQINALHYSCIGGNLSTLEFLLDYGVESSLCGSKNITALHLLIYMPAESVDRAVSLLLAHGATTDTCSQEIHLEKMGLDLVGTPVEWAVIARNRGLVAALLPHSKGQERSILTHAISHAYYEIAEDLLSNKALSGLFTEEDCPILIFCRAFAHLTFHGRNSDLAVERTIRLCNAHNLIHYEAMLRCCMLCARTRACLKALEVLVDLCPPSIVRQGFESDKHDEVTTSILYTALRHAKSNKAWRPVLEAILRNFSIAELNGVSSLKKSGSADIGIRTNVLYSAVAAGWPIAVQVLLEKGVEIDRKIDPKNSLSSFDVAAWVGNIEMQAILSRHSESLLGSSMAPGRLVWWVYVQKRMRRRGFDGFDHNNPDDKVASTLTAVSKAHEVLCLLLMVRDSYFSDCRAHARYMNFKILLWDEFRALISCETIAGYIDTPDEDDVTMLQRATTYLDIDVIRLLLEAGADANVPFLATKRVDNDENDLIVPLLPIQIACWVSRTAASLFEKGTIKTKILSDAIATKQIILEPTRKPHILRRVTHIISHAAGTGAKRIKGLKSGPALTSGARVAESLRVSSLNVAQEFLRWHLLRNDRRFQGITEFHLCAYSSYVSRVLTLVRQNLEITDAKASWPGKEGKYTGQELAHMPWKDELATFSSNFYKLRGIELAKKSKGSGI